MFWKQITLQRIIQKCRLVLLWKCKPAKSVGTLKNRRKWRNENSDFSFTGDYRCFLFKWMCLRASSALFYRYHGSSKTIFPEGCILKIVGFVPAFQLFVNFGFQHTFAFAVDKYNFLSFSVFIFLQYPVKCFHLIAKHIGVW